jgi:hypothetical protein
MWTTQERRSAQERALKQRGMEYILPVRLDTTPIQGLLDTLAYISIEQGVSHVSAVIIDKLWATGKQPKDRIGPPIFNRY